MAYYDGWYVFRFSKLDYVGISLLIVGSFVPWLFYGFYCRLEPKIAYTALICILGIGAVVVSLWEKFSQPRFRPLRAGVFVGLGLSGIIPCLHYFITDGFWSAVYEASLGWMVLMGCLYLAGAFLYAFRVPERYFPGKCDLWVSLSSCYLVLFLFLPKSALGGTTLVGIRGKFFPHPDADLCSSCNELYGLLCALK